MQYILWVANSPAGRTCQVKRPRQEHGEEWNEEQDRSQNVIDTYETRKIPYCLQRLVGHGVIDPADSEFLRISISAVIE